MHLVTSNKKIVKHFHHHNHGNIDTVCVHMYLQYVLYRSSRLRSRRVHLWVNVIHPCYPTWCVAPKHPGSVHHYSSPSTSVLVTFWRDESQVKTALSVLQWGRGLWNVAVVFGPTGRLDRREPKPDVLMRETGEETGFCSGRGMRVLKNISSVLLLLH